MRAYPEMEPEAQEALELKGSRPKEQEDNLTCKKNLKH